MKPITIKPIYVSIDEVNLMPPITRSLQIDNCEIKYKINGYVDNDETYNDELDEMMIYTDDSNVSIEIISFTDENLKEFEDFDSEALEQLIKNAIEWEQ